MIVKVPGKTISKEYVALLLCVFVAVNSVHGTVLCFGSDGHIEFEPAFHERCAHHDNSLPADLNGYCETNHERDKHCDHGQCVDVPIDVGLARISQTSEKLDRAPAAVAADAILAIKQLGCLESGPASNAFFATSYFNPLRTVILLA